AGVPRRRRAARAADRSDRGRGGADGRGRADRDPEGGDGNTQTDHRGRPIRREGTIGMGARRMQRARSAVMTSLALAGFLGLASAQAQDETPLFRGKTVRMIVGSTAGGVTDVGARTVARFLGKYLPQSPNIVVQNMPAANGIAAANHFYQQVAPDGFT